MLFFLAAIILSSCQFFDDGQIEDKKPVQTATISNLKLSSSSKTIKVGEVSYINYTVSPVGSYVDAIWNYNSEYINVVQETNGAVITGLKEGMTSLTVRAGRLSSTCIITVSGIADNYEETKEPYIYSNTTVLQTSPGVTEKVFVSLYGGTVSDIEGYTWTIDNSSVASIQPTGQYCYITARDTGYARIKITHPKASYAYYIGVYVFDDATKVSYITTTNNILTMNQSDPEKTITVNLINGKDTSSNSQFTWEIREQSGSECPIGISKNGNQAVITPLKGGSCTVRVTHPDSVYPLDILCRVITIVKNVYIEPNSTIVYLDGTKEETVTNVLKNIDVGEYSIDDYSYVIDNYSAADVVAAVGNQVILKGIGNGSAKLLISHPKAAYSREVLLIVTGQLTDAIDASYYITTSQNYIRTKVGANVSPVSISLKGGEDGDEAGFIWSVSNNPADGSYGDVISLETPTGTVENARMVISTFAYGNAYITPLKEGTAVITIKHPKIIYPTEILVKVLSADTILEEPLYFKGSGLVRILNGTEYDYNVELKGENKKPTDSQNIRYSIDNNKFGINGNEETVKITAPALGNGQNIANLKITHDKVDADKSVLILTADTEEELLSMKALFSDKLYYNFEVGTEATVMCNAVGWDTEEGSVDYSTMTWTVENPSIISAVKNVDNPITCQIRGLKAGQTKLTANYDGYKCDFTITVYPKGAVAIEPEVYFTTSQNVVSLSGAGKSTKVNISAINLKSSEYSNISWNCEDSNVCTVISNGNFATITAVSEGETVINVNHPDSQNNLKIYVRVGSEYVIKDAEPVCYISSQDVITLLRDDPATKLQAMLVNYSGSEISNFTFTIDNEDIAKITAQTPTGIAYVKPVASGQAQITINNTIECVEKKVLVIVGNSKEELAGFTYLTTNNNVVGIGEGQTKTVTVSVQNSDEVILDGFSWNSNNPAVVDVIPNGSTAVFKGNSIGTALITVQNKYCQYPLQIIAQVVDPIAAAANPYIQLTSSVLLLTVGTTYSSITADLVGGTQSDYSDFEWYSNDTSMVVVYGQNEVGKVRALKEGQTYIKVHHKKANYDAQILVVAEEQKESECYISVPTSIYTMLPTDSSTTINASLINGTATDKYNFKWSMDVFDIVDYQWSANVCTITPKQTGTVTITISHPKSAYDQKIIVNVQQYTSFAFPSEYITVEQGTVQFINMKIPTTQVATRVEYQIENSSIATISGTKTVAQLTGVKPGTTTVTAKLIASSTGVVQSTAEMMIYVKERDTNAVYITTSSTINTVDKGKSKTLQATLVGAGVVSSDQYNFKWTTTDSDIIQVIGIGSDGCVTGQSVYITALKPGEAIITCSHEKAASNLQFYVYVPGTGEKTISLNKTYMTLLKGSGGSTIKATIDNSENGDYNNLIWTAEGANGEDIVRVMGNGQTVTIYPLAVGEATVMAQLPDSSSVAKCTVVVEAGKSLTFETNSRKIQPFHTKTVNYKVSPPTALLTWTVSSDDDYFEYKDLGCDSEGNGKVEITGIREGSGVLACVTDGAAKGQITVKCAWDYEFAITGATTFSISPAETKEIGYKVSPADAVMKVESTDAGTLFDYEIIDAGDGTGKVIIKPITESMNNVAIKILAQNQNKSYEEIGSKIITAKFQYTIITPVVTAGTREGSFSVYDSDNFVLTMGDGESLLLNFGIKEQNALAYIDSVVYKPSVNNGLKADKINETEKVLTYKIHGIADVTKTVYKIDDAYIPVFNGEAIPDWSTDFYYRGCIAWGTSGSMDCIELRSRTKNNPVKWWTDGSNGYDVFNSGNWSKIRNITEIGKEYDINTFNNIPLYYHPYLSSLMDGSNPVVVHGGINREFVTVSPIVTSDISIQTGSGLIGYLEIYINHRGTVKRTRSIPVYAEIRNCKFNF